MTTLASAMDTAAVVPLRGPPAGRRGIPNEVLGMTFFLIVEIMLFAGLISAYLVLRAGFEPWPPPDQPRLPVALTALNTLVLLSSGFALWAGIRRLRAGEGARLLGVAVALGLLFLAIQGFEWARLIAYGLTISSSVYGGIFYTVVGTHAAHVVVGVILLLWVLRRATAGVYDDPKAGGLDACRMYWLAVVGIWPPIFVLTYLI
jgi:heme/copper-type cytochrome/quinol oxidase subunit 3